MQSVKYNLITLVCLLVHLGYFSAMAQGPYAPPVGQPGTTAMKADSSVFSAWASATAVLARGNMNCDNPSAGPASAGDQNSPVGEPGENGVVSLGDGGFVVLTFDEPFSNHPGPDFAVFENSFSDDFLEMAFVEVSSDGVNFVRFDAISLTDTSVQVGSFGSIDATEVNNLAGKYRGGYGTPFDLEELDGNPLLDINNITHIKIIDAVGSITSAFRTIDSEGRVINDPWPTEFPSSGFDLDAVGVISEAATGFFDEMAGYFSFYPNPAVDRLHLTVKKTVTMEIMDFNGRVLLNRVFEASESSFGISLRSCGIVPGNYLVRWKGEGVNFTKILIVAPSE